MSFSSYQEIQPLPTVEDYGYAFEIFDENFKENGGINFFLAHQALRSLSNDQLYVDRQRALATGSLLTFGNEGSNDSEHSEAYTNGFFATAGIVDILYRGPQDLERHQDSLDKWWRGPLMDQVEDDHTAQLLRRERIISFSKFGLQEIGEKASAILNRWTQEVYGDEPHEEILSELFRLGCGVLIASGIIRQQGINRALIIHETSGLSLDNELFALLESQH